MNHDELINKLLSGEIGPEEFSRIEKNLNGSLQAEDLTEIEGLLSKIHYKDQGGYENFFSGVERKIVAEFERAPGTMNLSGLRKFFAAGAILVGLTGIWLLFFTKENSSGEKISPKVQISQPVAEVQKNSIEKENLISSADQQISARKKKITPEKIGKPSEAVVTTNSENTKQQNSATAQNENPHDRHQEKIAELRESLNSAAKSGDKIQLAVLSLKLGILYEKLDDRRQARKFFFDAAEHARAINLHEIEAEANCENALIDAQEGKKDVAMRDIAKNLEILRALRSASLEHWEKELSLLKNQ